MNNEEIQKLKEKITEFENQDVFIEVQEALQYHFIIYQAKIITSNEKLIISNQNERDLIIELQYLEDIKIDGNIIDLEMSNHIKITLDY